MTCEKKIDQIQVKNNFAYTPISRTHILYSMHVWPDELFGGWLRSIEIKATNLKYEASGTS